MPLGSTRCRGLPDAHPPAPIRRGVSLKIVHLIETHTVYSHRLAEAFERKGHDVHILTFHDRHRSEAHRYHVREIRVPTWEQGLPFSHHWASLSRILATIRELSPDVLHGHYVSTAALYMVLAGATGKVLSAMGSDILLDTRALHARFLVRRGLRRAHRVISAADHVTARLQELGVPNGKIRTIPMGVDLALFHPGVRPIAQLGDPAIVCTRSLERVYRPDRLVRAMPDVLRGFSAARLVFIGGGSLREPLEILADKLDVRRAISFVGPVPHEKVPRYLAAADVYVSASMSDGTSASLLEAMATGCLPIVTDLPGNRPWVRHASNGLLVPLDEGDGFGRAILAGLRDAELRRRASGMNPRIVATRADWQSTIARMEQAYRETLEA